VMACPPDRDIIADRILLPEQPRWYRSHPSRSRCNFRLQRCDDGDSLGAVEHARFFGWLHLAGGNNPADYRMLPIIVEAIKLQCGRAVLMSGQRVHRERHTV